MRDELVAALRSGAATQDYVAALRELSERYPSRAFSMLLSALEIDRAQGQAITPALEQAAKMLKQDKALSEETKAELAQITYEFYAVAAIIGGITFLVLRSGARAGDDGNIYSTTLGLIVLGLSFGNMLLGLFRFRSAVNKMRGSF